MTSVESHLVSWRLERDRVKTVDGSSSSRQCGVTAKKVAAKFRGTKYSVKASTASNPRGGQIIYTPIFSQHTGLLEQFYM